MSLSFLYRGNAELCSAMAGAAKSEEIRSLWLELAEHWRKKAESDERFFVVEPDQECRTKPNIVTYSPTAKPGQEQQVNRVPSLASNLVPGAHPPYPEQTSTSHQTFSKTVGGQELEDDWTKLLADIRSK